MFQNADSGHATWGRLAGIFFPRPEMTLPIEFERELYGMLSSDVARQLKRRKVSENEFLSCTLGERRAFHAPAR